MTAAIETGTLTVDGIRSPFLARGPANARTAVVFVHGNPGPKEDWADLMARLPDGTRAFAPDLPGYGGADRPRGFAYTVDGYATHLGKLLDAAGIDRAHLVMHDFGGPWGLALAARDRGRVASLTMINTGVLLDYEWHRFAKVWQTPVLGELSMLVSAKAMFRRVMNKSNPRPFPDAFIDRIWRHMDWGHKRAVLKLYRATRDVRAGAEQLAAALRGWDVPVTVVFGAADPYLPPAVARAQRTVFPHAEIHELDGLGHWPFVDDPERVATLVIPFLARCLAGERAA